jgi:transcriptional regulator with XRE-family HTH domain
MSSLLEEYMAKFCERIRELRVERGLKQREMAEQFGLAINSYQCYEYETRYPEFPGLIAIADFFDVSLDYLVGRSDVRERR